MVRQRERKSRTKNRRTAPKRNKSQDNHHFGGVPIIQNTENAKESQPTSFRNPIIFAVQILEQGQTQMNKSRNQAAGSWFIPRGLGSGLLQRPRLLPQGLAFPSLARADFFFFFFESQRPCLRPHQNGNSWTPRGMGTMQRMVFTKG